MKFHYYLIFLTGFLSVSCNNQIDLEKEEEYFEYRNEILYYKGTPFNGETIERWDNKIISNSKKYSEGKLELFKSFFEDGSLHINQGFKDGKKHGLWEEYYSPNKLKAKGRYKNDKQSGVITEYFENGNVMTKLYPENDDIFLEEYFENGNLKHKIYTPPGQDMYDARFMADETYNINGDTINKEICMYAECVFDVPVIFNY